MHDTAGTGQGAEPSGAQAASTASGSSLLGSSSSSSSGVPPASAASNAPTTTATAPSATATAAAAAGGQSPSKRPASSSSSLGMGMGNAASGGRGFVDVLRSMGQLALCNAPHIQDELRFLVTGAAGGARTATSSGNTGSSSIGGGRRKGGPEEAAAVLAELASLASCINELVASAVGTVGSGEQGADAAEGGGGAVAVGGRLLGGIEEGEGGGLHLHSHATASSHHQQQYQQLHQLLQQQLHIGSQHLHAPHAPGPAAAMAAAEGGEGEDAACAHHHHLKAPRPSPVLAVLGDAALLHYVLDFVAAPAMAHRRQLGTLALVSRQWRDLVHSERFWRPIVLQLFPRLSPTAADHDEDEAAVTATATGTPSAAGSALAGPAGEGAQGSQGADWYRKYLVQYGRCLFEHPIRQGPWHEGITLSFDLHDEQDGTRLFSSTGPIRFTGTTIPGITAMKLTGRRRRVTTPFSASGRDPTGHLGSIEELFQEGDSPEYPAAFTIRVTARDERTGKMALLFSSSKRTKRWVEPLGEDMGVPQGTLLVNQGWTRVTIPGTDLAMQMLTVFYVAPVEAQAQHQQGQGQGAPQGQQAQGQQGQAGQQAGAPPPPLQQHGGGGGQQPQPQPAQQQQAAGAADGVGQGQGQGAGQGNAPPPAGGMAVAGGGGAAGPGGGGGGGAGNGPADPAHRQYAVLTLDCAFMLQCKTECTESIGRFILAALEHGPSLERNDD